MNQNQTKRLLNKWFDFKIRLIAEGIAVGLVAGLAVVLYRLSLEHALDFSLSVYSYLKNHWILLPAWLGVLLLGGWLTGLIATKEPMTAGSGIPQVKGVLQNRLSVNWWKTVCGKFVGGTISIGAGLSLGREGPSVQIGACMGQGVSRMMRLAKVEEHFLMTCGASAGLAAAFNAPIAGVIFALEELHGNFSGLVMISALASSVVADFVSKEFFGLQPVFQLGSIPQLPLHQYGHLLLLGVLAGLSGMLFNWLLLRTQDAYAGMRLLPNSARPIIPFLIAGMLGLCLPEVLGGGNSLVNSLLTTDRTFQMLLLLLVVKLLFTMVSFGSGAPGGIFLPMLVVGAMVGVLYGRGVVELGAQVSSYTSLFIILGMAGYFTAVVKAPITGIILITEMTATFSNLLPTGVVCLTAYMVAELMRSSPIYETLLERFMKKNAAGFRPSRRTRVILEIPVNTGSLMEGKQIKDLSWPAHCLIVGIRHGEEEKIPNGDTSLRAGDCLIIMTQESVASQVKEDLLQTSETRASAALGGAPGPVTGIGTHPG